MRGVLPLSLVLLGPVAQAAAFLPGPEADPPTGDTPAPAGIANGPAAEPLQADGFELRFGPWRRSGSLTLDARWLRSGGGTTIVQGVTHTQIGFASYLWQPWFAQVRFGVGVLTSNDRQSDDFNRDSTHSSATLTGRTSLSLFPASRFPFEFRAEFSDSRAGGDTLSGDVETRRISLSQSYTPPTGSDRLQLQIDHSRLESDLSADTLTTLMASAQRSTGAHSFELSASLSRNHTDTSDERTHLSTVVGRHAFQPSNHLHVDTLATITDFRTDGIGDEDRELGTQVRQIVSLVTWDPQPGQPLHWEGRRVRLAGSARWTDALAVGDGASASAQSLSVTGGATVDLSPSWRAGGGLTAATSRSDGSDDDTRAASANANLNWTPATVVWGEWSYGPTASVSAGASHSNIDGRRWIAGLQGGHALSRQWRLTESQAVSLSLSQSAGVLQESRAEEPMRSLAHGVGLYWQHLDDGSTQRYASLSLTDSRTIAREDGSYQFASLSLNQRTALSRFSSWSANLSLQASRNEATEIDAFTGARLTQGSGWQTYYSGGAALEQQRLFGVPRLRHTLQLTFNSQQVERREFGDIEATRKRVSAALESRIDYAVGLLALRLIGRLARVEGQTQAFLMARAQRSF